MTIKYIGTEKEFYHLLAAISDNVDTISIDTETTGFDPYTIRLLLISLYFNGVSYVIDMTKIPIKTLNLIKTYLEDPSILKIGHNLAYDWKVLFHKTGIAMCNMYDTMLAEKLIHAGIPIGFDLKEVISRRMNISMDKDIRKSFIEHKEGQIFSQEQIEYAGTDVKYLDQIRDQQLEDIEEYGLGRVLELEMSDIDVTARMELTGIPVNKQMLENLIEPFKRFVLAADQALQSLFIDAGVCDRILLTKDGYFAFNSASSEQVLELMHKVGVNVKSMDAKVVARWDFQHSKSNARKYGKVDYNDYIDDTEVATALDNYHSLSNPYLRAYAFYTGASKLFSTFVTGMIKAINPVTGRIHSNFNQLGAGATGRYSSSEINLQNLPNEDKLKIIGLGNLSIRKCIEAPKGRVLWISDYSGIELVILAVLSEDEKLLNEILKGDIHTKVCIEVLDYKDITPKNKKDFPHKLWRDASKKLSYSIAYGTTGKNVSDFLNIILGQFGYKISSQEGDELIKKWFNLFPKTAAYLQSNAEKAITEYYVTDTWGRRRNWKKENLFDKWKRLAAGREGMNAPIQGTSATMTKRAMRLVASGLDFSRARIIMTVHDELVVESTVQYKDTAAYILKQGMEQAIRETLPSISHMVGQYESLSVEPKESQRYDK